jgi:hypothetical protein
MNYLIEINNQPVFMKIDEIISTIISNPQGKYYKFINNERILICNDIVVNTLFICHRVNTVDEITNIPSIFGVEVDIRDNKEGLFLQHDPFNIGEDFETFLSHYNHKCIILNIKTEGVEKRCMEIMKNHNIQNYFFLDSTIPIIYKFKNALKENMCCRFSEIEPIEFYQKLQHMVSWVWVDCFTEMPLTYENYNLFIKDDKKICIVSPELQQQPEQIHNYRGLLIQNKTIPNAICCKLHNIYKWI